jgi:hypothetical protein
MVYTTFCILLNIKPGKGGHPNPNGKDQGGDSSDPTRSSRLAVSEGINGGLPVNFM